MFTGTQSAGAGVSLLGNQLKDKPRRGAGRQRWGWWRSCPLLRPNTLEISNYRGQQGFSTFRAETPSNFHHGWVFPPHANVQL